MISSQLVWCSIAVVQLISECFPVSSSGHIALLERILRSVDIALPSALAREAFVYIIHAPTLGLLLYFLWCYPRCVSLMPFIPEDTKDIRLAHVLSRNMLLWMTRLLIIPDGMTIGIYLFFQLIGKEWFPLPLGFALTAMLLGSLYWCPRANRTQDADIVMKSYIPYSIGIAQGIALLPGISRLGITYVCARWIGLSPERALGFSWIIQIPLLFLGVMKGCWMMNGALRSGDICVNDLLNIRLLLIMVLSSYGAWYSLRMVLALAKRSWLWMMGWYLIIPIVCWGLLEFL